MFHFLSSFFVSPPTDELGQTFMPLQFSFWRTNYSLQYYAVVYYSMDQTDQSNIP